jgi:hypothetical protein
MLRAAAGGKRKKREIYISPLNECEQKDTAAVTAQCKNYLSILV